jgi:DNA-binding transcriptional MerR regulator
MMAGVTDHGQSERRLTIGEFATLTRLTVKALRIYDASGLLRPAELDRANGYRRYDLAQVQTARLIGLLRSVDMSLADIAEFLRDITIDTERAANRLDGQLRQLESRQSSRRLMVGHIHAIIRHKEPPMFEVHTRHVPAQRVMSIQRRLRADETDRFVAESKAAFAALLDGRPPTGPFTVIFHGIVDYETDGPIEVILGCPDDVGPNDTVGVRTEPAHDEVFTTIAKAQWDYPAIMAAYDAVGSSPEAQARPGSPLSCREVYLAEPEEVGENELICDIAFPLGDAARRSTPRRYGAPLTTRTWPVIQLDAAEARKTAAALKSSSLPRRPRGCLEASLANCASVNPLAS